MANTLKDVADLIKKDNGIIVENQEKTNESLKSIDSNILKFLKNQERSRLDNLEDRRERQTAKNRSVGISTGSFASTGAFGNAAGQLNFNPLQAFGIGGALGALGASLVTGLRKLLFATLKSPFTLLSNTVLGLKNVLDDRLHTQRGLNRYELRELERAATADARAVREERVRAQSDLRSAEIERRDAILRERAAARQITSGGNLSTNELAARQAELERLRQDRIRASDEVDRLRASIDDARLTETQLRADVEEFKNARRAQNAQIQRDVLRRFRDLEAGAVIPQGTPRATTAGSLSAADPMPTVDTPASQLSAFTDAELEAQGYRRLVQADGRVSYRKINPTGTLSFASHDEVLRTLRAARSSTRAASRLSYVVPIAGQALAIADTAAAGAIGGKTAVETARLQGREATSAEVGAGFAAEFIGGFGDLYSLVDNLLASGANKLLGTQLSTSNDLGGQLRENITEGILAATTYTNIGQNQISPRTADNIELAGTKVEQALNKVAEVIMYPFSEESRNTASDIFSLYARNPNIGSNTSAIGEMDYSQFYGGLQYSNFYNAPSTTISNNNQQVIIDEQVPTVDGSGGGLGSPYATIGGR